MSEEPRPEPPEAKRPIRGRWGLARIGRILLGGALVILGVVGLFLPFLQGILFLVIGLTLLAPELPPVKRLLLAAYRRWPRVRRRVPRKYRRFRRTRTDGGVDGG